MNAYRELIRDTLALVKEERKEKEVILSSKELSEFFSQNKTEIREYAAPVISMPIIKPRPVEEVKSIAPIPVAAPKPQKVLPTPSDEWKKALMRNFPHLTYVEQVPDDAKAKELAAAWKKYELKVPVLMLSFGEKEEDLLYLKNLAKAIQTHLKPVKILDALSLEKDKKWETLFDLNTFELIIASEMGLMGTQELKRIYNSGFKIPLLFLNPEIKKDKASLWKRICHLLKR
jgi:hypothetical protein